MLYSIVSKGFLEENVNVGNVFERPVCSYLADVQAIPYVFIKIKCIEYLFPFNVTYLVISLIIRSFHWYCVCE